MFVYNEVRMTQNTYILKYARKVSHIMESAQNAPLKR